MKNKSACFIRWVRIFLLTLSLILLLASDAIAFDRSLASLSNLTRWNEFNFVSWVTGSLLERIGSAAVGIERFISDEKQTELVERYLEESAWVEKLEANLQGLSADPALNTKPEALTTAQNKLSVEKRRLRGYSRVAESILQNQSERSLLKMGFGVGGQVLPPLLFKISDLPLNLIISPRDQIGTLKSLSLKAGMDSLEKEELEQRVFSHFNLSALVEPVGGLGAYPTMVMRTQSLNWLTEVVAHEWTHNYLSFFPLGVRYFESNELRSMNETLANIAGKEIGRRTMLDYYPGHLHLFSFAGREPATVLAEGSAAPFNFRAQMRETRLTVDYLLEKKLVTQAERYMESRRQFFWENGYHLRKINQAYFAFYGSYNDTPGGGAAGSDPIGPAVQQLRGKSPSLKVFVDRMKNLTSFPELIRALE